MRHSPINLVNGPFLSVWIVKKWPIENIKSLNKSCQRTMKFVERQSNMKSNI